MGSAEIRSEQVSREQLADWRSEFHERSLDEVSGDEQGAVHRRTEHAKRTLSPDVLPLAGVLADLNAVGVWGREPESRNLVFGTIEEWLIEVKFGEKKHTVHRIVFDEQDADLERVVRTIMKRARG